MQKSANGSATDPTLLARRFHRKTMDLARKGVFDRSLKTYVPALREAYIHWLSLLEHRDIPVLLYGERGTGKRKHVEEYYYLQNVHAGLLGEAPGKFKVFRGDFLEVGFSRLLYAPKTSHEDVVYFEHVDRMSAEVQEEFLEYLKLRKEMGKRSCPVARVFIGTERALSLSVMKGEFNKELFQMLTGFAIFMPSLRDRAEDMPHMLVELIQEISGKKQLPPVWLVDVLSGQSFYENIDELKKLLRNLCAKKADVSTWKKSDLLPSGGVTTFSFEQLKPNDITAQVKEKQKLKAVLGAYKGDTRQAAQTLGISKTEILQKMMVYGIR